MQIELNIDGTAYQCLLKAVWKWLIPFEFPRFLDYKALVQARSYSTCPSGRFGVNLLINIAISKGHTLCEMFT